MASPTSSTGPNEAKGVYTNVDELLRLRHLSRDLTLTMRKRSQALLEGSVRTRYRGRGMEFAEVRPYQPGDDIRTIDWRVTARVQAPYTKLFQEERERPIFVMVDQRSPMFFGSRFCFKSVYAAQIASVVAWIANHNSDRIGGLLFGDTRQADIRAKRSQHAVLELMHQLVDFNRALTGPVPPATSISLLDMLTETSRIARPGSLVILISDYHDFTPQCREPLSQLAKRSDVMALHVYDPLERQLPHAGQLAVSDGQQRMTLNVAAIAQSFEAAFDQHQTELRQSCATSGVQYVQAPVNQPLEGFVRDLFSPRRKTRHNSAGGSL
jgi:uncharacterized protein (DUF58 family)